jgi:7,8-dihydropterin-6-yl-methyl-4-(beta-D-ribofuranosyl)aminobenzene 5'-phosphate synthase
MRLTGVDRLHGLLGGFHLTGPVPAHCTGWRAQMRFATTLPDAFVPNAVGTSFVVAAS